MSLSKRLMTAGAFCHFDIVVNDKAAYETYCQGARGWTTKGHVGPKDAPDKEKRITITPLPGYAGKPRVIPYVNVLNIKATMQRAVAAGATELSSATMTIPSGSLAVFKDPFGALCGLYEPKDIKEFVDADSIDTAIQGQICWQELSLPVDKHKEAQEFYSAVFLWMFKDMDGYAMCFRPSFFGEAPVPADAPFAPPPGYQHVCAGFRKQDPGHDGDAYWLCSLTSSDLSASNKRVEECKGRIISPPTFMGPGTMTVHSDIEGIVWCNWKSGPADPDTPVAEPLLKKRKENSA